MSQAIATILPDNLTPEQQAKAAAWAKMGLSVSATELSLQAAGQQASALLVKPAKIEDCAAAEEILKDVSLKKNNLVAKRKEITGKFDALTARLMGPEKALEGAIATQTAAIIAVKQAHKTAQIITAAKTAEQTSLRELVGIYVAQTHASYQRRIVELTDAAYKHALTAVPPDELETYLAKVSGRVTEAAYTMPKPPVESKLLTAEEIETELAESFKPQPAKTYIDDFALALKEKFSDYSIAWNNKDAALANHTTQIVQVQQAISADAAISTAEVQLEAAATVMEVGPVVKPLKQSYVVDMPDTYESAIKILSACIAHSAAVGENTRTTKYDSFGVLGIKRALAKIKSEDNDFEPKGIKFKIVEKL